MVQEAEKYRDQDEANESKCEAAKSLENYRFTVCNTLTERNSWRSLRAVTDADENMIRILITDDSQAKLTVVRQLELLEFHCLDGFSLDGTANAVLLTGSGI